MSQKRIRAPWRANASAVVVKVKEGTMTVSLGFRWSSIADSSRAEVHDVVSTTSSAPVCSVSNLAADAVNGPPEEVRPLSIAVRTYLFGRTVHGVGRQVA